MACELHKLTGENECGKFHGWAGDVHKGVEMKTVEYHRTKNHVVKLKLHKGE